DMARAVKSEGPPGGNGTTSRSGRLGNSAAASAATALGLFATNGKPTAASTAALIAVRRMRLNVFISCKLLLNYKCRVLKPGRYAAALKADAGVDATKASSTLINAPWSRKMRRTRLARSSSAE